jgi:GntR family transcriptional regulator, transcriptional repressor for pyruvate dehydrogenase complex
MPANTMRRGGFAPIAKARLSDELTLRIRESIQSGGYQAGDRLPGIVEMARRFGVGQMVVREALTKLETLGVVEVRHGSGVYVGRDRGVLVLASRDAMRSMTAKVLGDIVSARIPLELESVTSAARNASVEQVQALRDLVALESERLDDDELLRSADDAFHRLVALASGNQVLAQVLDVLRELLAQQDVAPGGRACRAQSHREHRAIVDAIEQRDENAAATCMRTHLTSERVRLTDPPDAST